MTRMYRYGILLTGLAGCTELPPCSSRILQMAQYPGTDRYATTEVRDCGATTGHATVVRVGRLGDPPSDATEIFVADGNHGAAGGGEEGAIWMSVVWRRPDRLSVAYASGARVFRRMARADGASIGYVPSEPMTVPPPPTIPVAVSSDAR